jgi:hypothetical protein
MTENEQAPDVVTSLPVVWAGIDESPALFANQFVLQVHEAGVSPGETR